MLRALSCAPKSFPDLVRLDFPLPLPLVALAFCQQDPESALAADHSDESVICTRKHVFDCCVLSICSVEQVLGHIAAVGSDAGEHCLVQPDVHLSRISHQIRWAAQLSGQLFARAEAAIDIEQL